MKKLIVVALRLTTLVYLIMVVILKKDSSRSDIEKALAKPEKRKKNLLLKNILAL